MIPNATTLDQLEANLNANRNDKHASSSSPSEVHVVVTYCTIGYRSGLEAQRLRDQYNLNVRNLDGIVSYTHTCTAFTASIKEKSNIDADGNANAKDVRFLKSGTDIQLLPSSIMGESLLAIIVESSWPRQRKYAQILDGY